MEKETNKTLEQLLAENQAVIDEAVAFLEKNGIQYRLDEWITVKEYKEKYGIENYETITNWIRRGVIPSDCVTSFPALNDLKLIRNREYKD